MNRDIVSLPFTLERYDPAYDESTFFPMVFMRTPHWARYQWAAQFCVDKRVADIACGSGYGTAYLNHVAAEVIGIDYDEQVIHYCRQMYPHIQFCCTDAHTFSLSSPVDVIVSMETIEHLRYPERFLERVCAALHPEGLFLCSTPVVGVVPKPPHHVREYTPEEFVTLLSHYFVEVECFEQTMQWEIDGQSYQATPMFLLALCRQPR